MAIITEENAIHVHGAIQDAARNACRKWAMQDWEDIANTVFERVWKMDRDGDFDDVADESEDFHKSIKRYAQKAVNDERVAYMYFTGAFLYPRQAVDHILENLVWGDTPGTLEEAESRVDVARSFDRLGENYKLALFGRYALGIMPQHNSAERRTLYRAFDALMNHLNFTTAPDEVRLDTLPDTV